MVAVERIRRHRDGRRGRDRRGAPVVRAAGVAVVVVTAALLAAGALLLDRTGAAARDRAATLAGADRAVLVQAAERCDRVALATLAALALGAVLVGVVVGNGRGVRRALERELTHRDHHDALTGLPNRAQLRRRLADALAGGARPTVALVDLHGFEGVNDTLGRAVGDELLRVVARRLAGCLRAADLAARSGDDEFAVVVGDVDADQARAVAGRIVDVLQEPVAVAGCRIAVGAGVGVAQGRAVDPSHDDATAAADDLLRDAGIALSVAKRTGHGRVEVFTPAMGVATTHRTHLQQELAHAVERGEIEVVYQPVVDLAARRPLLLEALARWRPPGRPAVPADVFIGLAEESGLIDRIGRHVLRTAARAARDWRRLPGQADVGVAVNVSVHQVVAGNLVELVVDALREAGLPPSGLALEITETAALGDAARVAPDIARLRTMGVRVAVDDFGAGYSSLGVLTSLDVSALKIDRSLLDFDTTRHGSLVMAIAELGHTLGLRVIAEGVETPGHLHRAREACCDAVQGFYLSRPLEAADVAEFLRGWRGAERLGDAVARTAP